MTIRSIPALLMALALSGCQQAAAPAPDPALGPDFACANTQVELRCGADGCQSSAAGEFTPMALSRTGGVIEVCAYSGCTQGQADLSEGRGNLEFIHAAMDAPVGAAAIIYDSAQHSATLQFDGFVVPMECNRQE